MIYKTLAGASDINKLQSKRMQQPPFWGIAEVLSVVAAEL